jgi:hypothetical protein
VLPVVALGGAVYIGSAFALRSLEPAELALARTALRRRD